MTDEDMYNIEKILDRRVMNGRIEYKIKWEGYPMSQCTWEPLKNLETVKELLTEFDNNHHLSNKSSKPTNEKQKKNNSLTGKKRRQTEDQTKTEEKQVEEEQNNNNENEVKNDIKVINIKNTPQNDEVVEEEKNIYKIDDSIKQVITVKIQDQKLVALVEKSKENGEIDREYIPTEELRKINPWVLLNFYESKIKFT